MASVPDRPGRPAVRPVARRPGQMRPLDFRNCVGQADDLKAGGKTVGDWVNCGLLVPARDHISEPITLLDLDFYPRPTVTCSPTAGFSAHGLPRRLQFPPAESLPGVGRTNGPAHQAGDVWARPGLPLKLARLAHQDHWVWLYIHPCQVDEYLSDRDTY
ncbi:hypothetical protein BDD12DRAFT_802988 [Trichophaea hybrida]|nr:hypothetical protein BDD12DRAFT_802988 [Trichophaea hybrida]